MSAPYTWSLVGGRAPTIVPRAVPSHLRPSAPTAPAALLCGDPGRALVIAQGVLTKPRMSNHNRGLWGYHGTTAAGAELTVQATGIGGPSAAIVLGELAALGVRRAIRVGTCSAAGAGPGLGAGVVVGRALACDGTSVALGASPGAAVEADAALTRLLAAELATAPLPVASRDLPAGPIAPGLSDLQTAAMLAACRGLGVAGAATLVVSSADGRRLDDESLEAASLRLAAAAAGVLQTL